jgi:exodeoxyribonuclease VII large subunit
MAPAQALSVSDLLTQIKDLLEGEFRDVLIEGEISNLSLSASGHYYFSLSDKDCTMSAALFKMDAYRNPVVRQLKDGDQILCTGRVGVYLKRGTFQLIVSHLTPSGLGELKIKFELLKKQLAAEGLFDLQRKRKIPAFPRKIALVTALSGAALHDFVNVYFRRALWGDIMVVNALVQGESAPQSIRGAMNKVLQYNEKNDRKVDVVVLSRGGGSMEDLWAFNDPDLARVIFRFPLPVISAVGHQVDFTISDFVADLRAETPTAAAEILSEGQVRPKERMDESRRHLLNYIRLIYAQLAHRLRAAHPQVIVEKIYYHFLSYSKRLAAARLRGRLHDLLRLHEWHWRLDEAMNNLKKNLGLSFDDRHHRLEKAFELLRGLNPQNVLSRGYAFIQDRQGQLLPDLKSYNLLTTDEKLDIYFHDGVGKARKE